MAGDVGMRGWTTIISYLRARCPTSDHFRPDLALTLAFIGWVPGKALTKAHPESAHSRTVRPGHIGWPVWSSKERGARWKRVKFLGDRRGANRIAQTLDHTKRIHAARDRLHLGQFQSPPNLRSPKDCMFESLFSVKDVTATVK
jgi:hypothetical protein